MPICRTLHSFMAKLNKQVDPFWKEIIERKNQEILERFVKDLDSNDSLINRKYPTHPELPPLNSKKQPLSLKEQLEEEDAHQAIFKKEWKEITERHSQEILDKATKERHNFIVYDFDERELGRARTINEAYNIFLERYPQFDKNAIDAFITTINK